MTTSRVIAVLIVAAFLSFGPTTRAAFSASIDVIGTAGLPGVAGVIGPPATDGSPGGDGGAAVAVADALDPSNQATATGGAGGVGGAGGPAGDGGAGGDGGAASATAITVAPSPQATASATGGSGGSGGAGGGAGGVGGDASALASANSSSGGAVADSRAVGGAGGSGGLGGNAYGEASASGVGNDSVVARAFVQGGSGGSNAGNGGTANAGPVIASSSGGGSVDARAVIEGGDGGRALSGGVNGAGADATIDNAVWAATSGAMTLFQFARGGDAGGSRIGEAALAGDATNRWVREFSASSLDLGMTAWGGAGFASSTSGTARYGHGGSASLLADLSNDAGSLDLTSYSYGGNAGGLGDGGDANSDVSLRTMGDSQRISSNVETLGGAAGRSVSGNLQNYCRGDGTQCRGGDAQGVVHAETLGYSEVSATQFVQGGAGGSTAPGDSTGATGGDGGSATGESSARGGGLFTSGANVRSTGGVGGDGSSGASGGSGGRGGDASGRSTMEVTGASTGSAGARATGGIGGAGFGGTVPGARSGDGGNAHAEALVTGSTGEIGATSHAIGARAGAVLGGATRGVDGNGVALASAFGAAAVRADALASGGASSRASAAASSAGSPINAHAKVEALSGPYGNVFASGATAVPTYHFDPAPFDEQGVVVLTHADPVAERAAGWLEGTSLDPAYLAGEIDVLALGSVVDREDALGGRSIRTTQSFSLDTSGLAPGTGVYLSFIELIGPAIDVLDVQLEADDTVLADFHFEESLAGADALLDPIHVLDVSLGSGIVTIDLELEFTVSTSAEFSSKFALYADTEAVPEARPAAMLVLLAVLVLTARSASPSRFVG